MREGPCPWLNSLQDDMPLYGLSDEFMTVLYPQAHPVLMEMVAHPRMMNTRQIKNILSNKADFLAREELVR